MTTDPAATPDVADPSDHPGIEAADLPPFPIPSPDPRAKGDALAADARVALSSSGAVVLLRHEDVVEAAHDPVAFSSAVSAHLQLPNGLDGDEHAAYRALVDGYFTPARMELLAPVMREVARDLFAELLAAGRTHLDAVHDIGAVFAVRAQTRWLGWPRDVEPTMLAWMEENREATRSADRVRTAEVARRFDEIIHSIIAPRREAGDRVPEDVTTALMNDTSLGRGLTDEELVSILRNWTGGDLGSIALCVGVLVHYLATHAEVTARLRAGAPAAEVAAIVDEILRIDDPFVANRRVTTCPVSIGGVSLAAGQRVVLNWTTANRDTEVFGDPDAFAPETNREHNLVYGTGPHVCPGRPLATLELCAFVEEFVQVFSRIELDPQQTTERATTPTGGYAAVPVVLG